jgi:hypothetical protein
MKFTLAIRAYEPAAVVDDYKDGSFETFDAIVAEVTEGERAGQHLRILVESGSPLAARWNRVGQTLAVSIAPERLAAQVLFAGAFAIEGEP